MQLAHAPTQVFRTTLFWLAATGTLLGLIALAWALFDLPARALVRGHLGDVGIMMVLVATIGLVSPGASPRVWLGVAAALGVIVEVGQAFGLRGEGLVGELTLGSTFDPFDLLAYALGLGFSAVALRSPSTT